MKFLLDTCMLTYLASRRPKVVANYLLNEQETAIAAIAWQEKNYGLLRLEPGRLKDALAAFLSSLGRPVMPYDEGAALWHARHRAMKRKDGNDAMVAAIAASHGLTVVTANTRDFAGFDVPVVNWLA